MSVVAKGRRGTTVIDLDGSQGNAFVLLGIAGQTMRESGFDKKTQDSILNEKFFCLIRTICFLVKRRMTEIKLELGQYFLL